MPVPAFTATGPVAPVPSSIAPSASPSTLNLPTLRRSRHAHPPFARAPRRARSRPHPPTCVSEAPCPRSDDHPSASASAASPSASSSLLPLFALDWRLRVPLNPEAVVEDVLVFAGDFSARPAFYTSMARMFRYSLRIAEAIVEAPEGLMVSAIVVCCWVVIQFLSCARSREVVRVGVSQLGKWIVSWEKN